MPYSIFAIREWRRMLLKMRDLWPISRSGQFPILLVIRALLDPFS
jgi:hypothetical protein